MSIVSTPVTASDGTFSAAGAAAWLAGFSWGGSDASFAAGVLTIGGSTAGAGIVVNGTGGITNNQLTATRVIFSTTGGLQTDSANLIYAETSGPRFQVGSSGTSAGLIAGYFGVSGFGGIWSSGVTPSTTNFAVAMNSGTTVLNVASGGQLQLRVNNVANLDASSDITIRPGTATPAGGSTSARLLFGTTAGFGVYYGSGAPSVSAAQGSLYLRSDGTGTADRLWVNTNGATTWTNVVTAA